MRNSKFLLTSLLAAATMSATAYGADNLTITSNTTIADGAEYAAVSVNSGATVTQDSGTATFARLMIHTAQDNNSESYLLNGGVLNITGGTQATASALGENDAGLIIGHWGNRGDGGLSTMSVSSGATLNVENGWTLLSWDTSSQFTIGGEANLYGISFSKGTNYTPTATLTLSGGGRLNLGAGGFANETASRGVCNVNLEGGTLGALESWSAAVAMNVTGAVEIDTTKRVTSASGASSAAAGDDAGATISLSGNITASASGTLTVSGSGTLDLSGATLSLSSEITNNATVTVSSDTVFVLSDSLKVGDTGNTYSLISGGTINGWNAETLSAENFQISGVVTSFRGASADVTRAGQVVFTAGTAGNIVWAGTSGNSTWNSSAENWTHNSAPTKFYALDNVTFGADAESETVTLESGSTLAVGTMTVASGDYKLTLASGTASITGSTLTVASGASLQIGDSKGRTVSLGFSDISVAGTLKFNNGNSTWSSLTFEEGGRLEILDGVNEVANLVVTTMTVNGGSAITSTFNKKIVVGTLTGSGNLSVTGSTSIWGPATLEIGTLSGYTGKAEFINGGSQGGLTVKITGDASGNGANASFVVGSGVTFWVEGSSARFDWNKITLSDGATLKLRNGYGTSNNGHDGSEILIDAAGGSATIAGSLYGNNTNILGKIHGTGTLNVTSAETEYCNDLKISAVLADGANDGDRLALNVNMGTGTREPHVGTLTLTGENTYSGGTTIAAGNLVAAHQSALGTGAVEVQSGATLKLGVAAVSAYGLSGAGAVSLASGTSSSTLTVNGGGDFSGTITGAIALVKSGSETLTLSGANTYSGGTTIEGGVLKVDSLGWGDKGNLGETFAQDKTVLKNGGVLEVTEAQNANMTSGYRDGGAMRGFSVANGEGTYRYSGEGTSYIAPNVNSSSEFQANSHIGIAAGAMLIFDVTNSTATLDVSKVIASNAKQETVSNELVATTGALKKTGAGTVILSGDNKYTGGTVIEAGTVVAAHANALGTTKGVEVKSGATLNLGASAVTVAGLSGAGTVDLTSGTDSATLTVNGGGVFTGTLSRVSLVKQGADSTLELSNAGNWISSATVEAGTLRIAPGTVGDYSYVSITSVSVSDGAKLEIAPNLSASVSMGLNAMSGVTFAAGASLIVDATGAAENDVLKIITSSVIKFNTGSEDVSLTSDNLDLFVNDFVTLKGWEGLADWSYDGSALSVTLTIPEPSVFGLLAGLGALALAGTRRRRKKA